MITYRELIKQATKWISKTEAEYLLEALSHKKRYELYLNDAYVPLGINNHFRHLLENRLKGTPIQYLVKTAYFLDFELYVDSRVLIPRFETEELVIKTINKIRDSRLTPNFILDLGTGAGNIAIALADAFPTAHIVATDISQDALAVANYNIKKYKMEKRISLINCNLFEFLKTDSYLLPPTFRISNFKFDVIISNPPYIPSNELAKLPTSVRNYEPRIALDGGEQGFEIIKKIITEAENYLNPNGFLALEIDPRQERLIANTVKNATVRFELDLQENIRYAFISYFS
ncbi:MAG: peptide chain release factor N(5)-glutamine methyltransferase [candidate division WOR-3 bacterium]|nr:peptide chain release factor N(5)-glutamine methyltransferase [candidate division WOR-3 bacterium]MCX7757552.1 peptide chain release factor N(5)-glutamine methyltransferase [candidate division WOR-3 bacterium]MDW7987106.1 peptide chain release factor N(5)-glutamine methyltransferase [candidate division WOR-3 bacterium]